MRPDSPDNARLTKFATKFFEIVWMLFEIVELFLKIVFEIEGSLV